MAFHHTVAHLLFVSARARGNLQTAVAFLTTWFKYPDEDYWGKLNRVLKYLKETRHMKVTLLVNSVSMIRLWVDAFYNANDDYKGHTVENMSLEKRYLSRKSMKQKLNMHSSAEGELVGMMTC